MRDILCAPCATGPGGRKSEETVMRDTDFLVRLAGSLLALAGVLHLVAYVLGGFGYGALGLAPAGLVFLAMGLGLSQGRRWLAYLAFIAVGLAMSFVIRDVFVTPSVPSWCFMGIIAVDAAVIVALFVHLWRSPKPSDTAPA